MSVNLLMISAETMKGREYPIACSFYRSIVAPTHKGVCEPLQKQQRVADVSECTLCQRRAPEPRVSGIASWITEEVCLGRQLPMAGSCLQPIPKCHSTLFCRYAKQGNDVGAVGLFLLDSKSEAIQALLEADFVLRMLQWAV